MSDHKPTIVQVLPALESGGVERGRPAVEMNDDGFDDDNFTSGIGNNVNHVGGDDEYHQL